MNVQIIDKAKSANAPMKKTEPYILIFKTNIKFKKDIKKIEALLKWQSFYNLLTVCPEQMLIEKQKLKL